MLISDVPLVRAIHANTKTQTITYKIITNDRDPNLLKQDNYFINVNSNRIAAKPSLMYKIGISVFAIRIIADLK